MRSRNAAAILALVGASVLGDYGVSNIGDGGGNYGKNKGKERSLRSPETVEKLKQKAVEKRQRRKKRNLRMSKKDA